jgi:hypothetical protein
MTRSSKTTKPSGKSEGSLGSADRHGRDTLDSDAAPEEIENSPQQQDFRKGIGYRKPPRQHQWPKGRSGNPAGRKKGSKNKRTIIVRLMEQKLGRKIEDLSKLTRYEALLLKGIQKALTGDTKAMAFILRRYDDAADAHAATAQIASEHDAIVYAALVDKIRRELEEAI